jgi:hypothetical protein
MTCHERDGAARSFGEARHSEFGGGAVVVNVEDDPDAHRALL